MSQNTSIEWADHTWTPVVGCDAISPACAFCYAATMAARLEAMGMEKYAGLATRNGSVGKWTGKITVWEPEIVRPLSVKKPGRWFLTSMGDVGHDDVLFETLDMLFTVMMMAEQHEIYVLTKRPEKIGAYLEARRSGASLDEAADRIADLTGQNVCPSILESKDLPLPNVIIGCTVENQARADELRPYMKAISDLGWRTMVSYEPALEVVDWTGWDFICWMISGGESGPKARPSHPDAHRGARDFCAAHAIAYLFKQHGEWIGVPDLSRLPGGSGPGFGTFDHRPYDREHESVRVGKKAAGRLLDGRTHDEFPKEMR